MLPHRKHDQTVIISTIQNRAFDKHLVLEKVPCISKGALNQQMPQFNNIWITIKLDKDNKAVSPRWLEERALDPFLSFLALALSKHVGSYTYLHHKLDEKQDDGFGDRDSWWFSLPAMFVG